MIIYCSGKSKQKLGTFPASEENLSIRLTATFYSLENEISAMVSLRERAPSIL